MRGAEETVTIPARTLVLLLDRVDELAPLADPVRGPAEAAAVVDAIEALVKQAPEAARAWRAEEQVGEACPTCGATVARITVQREA